MTMSKEIQDRSANRRGSKRAGQISRRDVLKGAAAIGLGAGGDVALGSRPAWAQTAPAKGGPVTLYLLVWEHWKVAEGLQ
jgi:hypothetical protein